MQKNESDSKNELKPVYVYPAQTVNSEEDEIDLWELWQTVKKRKYIILVTTLLVLAIALVYVFTRKPVYEAKATVEIGYFTNTTNNNTNRIPLETANNLLNKLKVLYHVGDKNYKRKYPIIGRLEIPKKSNSLVRIVSYGYNSDSANKFLEKVLIYITNKHKKLMENYITTYNRKILSKEKEYKEINSSVNKHKNEIELLRNNIPSLNKTNPALAGLYGIELMKKENALAQLKSKLFTIKSDIENLKLKISPVNIKKTHLVGNIVTYDNPVKPKKKLILAVALVTGLILGVLLAFFVEFIANRRKEIYEK